MRPRSPRRQTHRGPEQRAKGETTLILDAITLVVLLHHEAAMDKLEKRQLEMDANDTDATVCNKSAL